MGQDSLDILWSGGIRGWPGRSVQSPSMEENFENVLSVYFTSQSFRLEDFQFCLWRWWWRILYTYQPTQLADAHCHALKSKNLPHLDFFEMFKKWRSRSFFQRISENLIFYEVEENLIIKFLQIISSNFKIFLSVQAEIMLLCPMDNFLLLCIIANYLLKVSLTPHAFQLFLRWALWARESGLVGRCQGRRWCTTSMGNQPRWMAKFKRMIKCKM